MVCLKEIAAIRFKIHSNWTYLQLARHCVTPTADSDKAESPITP